MIIINNIIELLTTKIPLGNWVENFINFLINNFGGPLNAFSSLIESIVGGVETVLAFPHPLVFIAIFAAIAWKLKGKRMALFVTLGLSLVLNIEMWDPLIITLASIITSVLIALIIGIPVGIIKAHNRVVDLITRPILDFMQTIPPSLN
ncbi:hypothetical protein [Halanaerobium congolense]|uniref:hypothetical protein n=1 Tax=Halanaerobium congolense TaxID=54121 RepID=UPI0021ACB167|nr:hypothetical protein [Halanaerobium congolense]